MGGLYFFTNFQRVAVPGTVFDKIQSDLNVSASAVTAFAAVFLYVYAGMQFFVGTGAERFGPGKMFLVGGFFLSAGSVLFPLSPSLVSLYLSRALVGLGASFMYVSLVKATVNMFEARHFAPLLGVVIVMGYSGGLAATAPLERLVARFGWRTAFLAAGIICSAVYLFVAALLRRTGEARREVRAMSVASVKEFFRTRAIYPILVCGPINFAMYYVLQVAVGKKILEDCCGFSSRAAANVTFAMLFTVIAGSLAGGFLPRLVGNRRRPFVIAASIGVVAGTSVLVGAMIFKGGAAWFVAGYMILAATNMPALIGTPLFKEISPSNTSGFAIGVLNGTTYFVVALACNAAGRVMDAFKDAVTVTQAGVKIYPPAAYLWMFIGMAALALVSLAASLSAPETRGEQRVAQAEKEP